MTVRRLAFVIASVLTFFAHSSLLQLEAASKLPFADGTYVTDTALCRMTANEIGEKYLDRIGAMVYNIRGSKLDNSYEMYCELANVQTSGKKVRFELYCETEGETDTSTETWTIVGKNSFRVGKKLYTYCGRFLD